MREKKGKTISFYMQNDLLMKAKALDMPLSQVVNEALREYFKEDTPKHLAERVIALLQDIQFFKGGI